MAKLKSEIEATCPCCQATLVFDVNLGAAAREHIEPTTRLLALARAIDGQRKRK